MSNPVRSSVQINYLVTAYGALTAHKTVAVTAESPAEAAAQAEALLAQDADLSDGWTALPHLTLTPASAWDIAQTDGRTLARPTALLDDATAEALLGMLSEASDNHAARLFDLEPLEAVEEVEKWDRVVAFLRGNGIREVDLRPILANLPCAEDRAMLAALVADLDEAARDDASRAMLAYDLDDQAWDALPEAVRAALIAAVSGATPDDLKAKADAYDRAVAKAQAYDARLNARQKAPEGNDYAELFDLIVPTPAT